MSDSPAKPTMVSDPVASPAAASVSNVESELDGREIYDENNEEHRSLRKVPGSLTWMLFVVCIIEMGERFVYIGVNAPLQNYIQYVLVFYYSPPYPTLPFQTLTDHDRNPYPYNANGIPGALGRGQSTGVALGNFFKFWAYFCVVIGAIVCDQWLGKFKTIVAATPLYVLGMIILVLTSTPFAIEGGASMGGLVVAIITIGIGTGGLKACIAPMCGEQFPLLKSYVRVNKHGVREVVDVKMTSTRVYLWYYWAANLGSLSGLATTSLEKAHSFWLGFLLPLLVYIVAFIVFVLYKNKFIHVPPTGSPIVDAWHTCRIAIKEKGFANASPTVLRAKGRLEMHKFAAHERYTDTYVAEIKSGIVACKYFALFPFFFLTWIQSFSNLVAQAGSMDVGQTPNDLMMILSTIFLLGIIPILDFIVYPILRSQFNIVLTPITRVSLGFASAGCGMAYACILQHFIYNRPPHSIYIWIQAPAYVFLALSEIWVVSTGLEIAFMKAPQALRAFVSSIFWMTVAAGAVIGMIMAPVSKDPYMVWLYGSLAICAFISGSVFYIWFRDSAKQGTEMAGQGAILDGVAETAARDKASDALEEEPTTKAA